MNWTMSVVNAAEAEAPPRRGPSSVVGADGEPVGELGADADIRAGMGRTSDGRNVRGGNTSGGLDGRFFWGRGVLLKLFMFGAVFSPVRMLG